MRAPTTDFEKQVIQIAALGVWQIVTGQSMSRRLEPVDSPQWGAKTGLFVTIKKHGQVRGSMGLIESTSSLAETLFDAAQTAATHDGRFPPITSEEIPHLEMHVTLLSEIKKLKNAGQLEVGRMGLIISRGDKQAVLLPHVATDQNWSAEQFLEATCEKAQLSHKAWQDPNTLVEYFTCEALDGGNLNQAIEEFI